MCRRRPSLAHLALLASAALSVVACASTGGGSAEVPAAAPAVMAAPPPPSPEAINVRGTGDYEASFTDDPIAGGAVGEATTNAKAPPAPPPVQTPASTPAKPVSPPPSTAPQADTTPASHREALLIYTATLVLAVYQVETSLAHIEDIARSVGGYLASRNDASIVIRVPRARFHESLEAIAKLGDVLHRDIQAEDVGDQVVDLEARLKSARAVRDRLAQLLQGATATKDALAIEKELARVMSDIEVMEGKLKFFADRVAYSTVTVRFQPLQNSDVHTMARLPFPWLQQLGLAPLLRVQ